MILVEGGAARLGAAAPPPGIVQPAGVEQPFPVHLRHGASWWEASIVHPGRPGGKSGLSYCRGIPAVA
ncbi:hypothetical protein NCCP2165_20750 [Halomonas sp. NCCP-2165]|nr:hypothetical protein NCCP2165_20750 [Halomonas sp. NCCP-2165]